MTAYRAYNPIPAELHYTQTHEWIRVEADGTVYVGITDHAQAQMGDLVFVDLPDLDIKVHASDEICVIESVKAASDVYSPLTGKIIATNEDLEESPGLVNSDPYGDGWLFKLQISDPAEMDELLDAEAYSQFIEEDQE